MVWSGGLAGGGNRHFGGSFSDSSAARALLMDRRVALGVHGLRCCSRKCSLLDCMLDLVVDSSRAHISVQTGLKIVSKISKPAPRHTRGYQRDQISYVIGDAPVHLRRRTTRLPELHAPPSLPACLQLLPSSQHPHPHHHHAPHHVAPRRRRARPHDPLHRQARPLWCVRRCLHRRCCRAWHCRRRISNRKAHLHSPAHLPPTTHLTNTFPQAPTHRTPTPRRPRRSPRRSPSSLPSRRPRPPAVPLRRRPRASSSRCTRPTRRAPTLRAGTCPRCCSAGRR